MEKHTNHIGANPSDGRHTKAWTFVGFFIGLGIGGFPYIDMLMRNSNTCESYSCHPAFALLTVGFFTIIGAGIGKLWGNRPFRFLVYAVIAYILFIFLSEEFL